MPTPLRGFWGRRVLLALAWVAVAGGWRPAIAAPAVLEKIDEIELPAGLSPLDAPAAIAFSSDGLFAYLVAQNSDSLSVLAWDAGLETLSPIQTIRNDVDVPSGLDFPVDIAISPDGSHVYAASDADDTISIFARDAGTGEVTYLQNADIGLDGMTGVAISADGAYVYGIGRWANAIRTYARDAVTGTLTSTDLLSDGVGGVIGMQRPLDLALSPDDTSLYVASVNSNAVAAFSRDVGTGLLSFEEAEFDGFPRDGLSNAQVVTVSPDGANVYVGAGLFDNGVSVFTRDPVTSRLTWIEAVVDGENGADDLREPTDVLVSPDGAYLYVTASVDDALTLFARDAGTGTLTFVERLLDGVGGVDGLDGARRVVLHPGGAHLVTLGVDDDTVSTFARDGVTGQATFIGAITGTPLELGPASDLALAPDGLHLYMSTFTDSIASFARDPGTGLLSIGTYEFEGVDGVVGLDRPERIALSPDGAHLYAAALDSGSVAVFSRDAGSGDLTFVEAQIDGVGGADWLGGANDVVVSPDGLHVYVAGLHDRAITIFGRDAGSGALSVLATVRDDAVGGTVAKLARPVGLVLSPDGAHLYALADTDDAVVAFSRDPGTGGLSVIQEVGTDVLRGLDLPRRIEISPDGATVYVAASALSPLPDPLFSLARDASSGLLTLIDTEQDGRDGVDGIDNVRDLVMAPNGERLYATGNTIANFVRLPAGKIGFSHVTEFASFLPRLAVSPDSSLVYAAGSNEAVRTYLSLETCPAAPRAGCRVSGTAGSGKLKIQQKAGTNGALKWIWKAAGEQTVQADFGVPGTYVPEVTTNFGLCGYDESGAPTLVFRALVPGATPSWRRSGSNFKMKNRSRSPEGVDALLLKAPVAGKGLVKAKAKGEFLTVPTIPLSLPFRLQLQSFGGGATACWEAVFSPAGVRKSTDRVFVGAPD